MMSDKIDLRKARMDNDDLRIENAALKKQLENQNGGWCDPYCFAGIKKDEEIARLKSLVEATETDLFEQKKKRRRLVKENENLSISIKGMASGKVNLDKSYQDLEKLYDRLEKANAALVKRWAELGEWVNANSKDIHRNLMTYGHEDTSIRYDAICDVIEKMKELEADSK